MDRLHKLAADASSAPSRYVRALLVKMAEENVRRLTLRQGEALPDVPARAEPLEETTYSEVDYRLRELCDIGDYRFAESHGEASGSFVLHLFESRKHKVPMPFKVRVRIRYRRDDKSVTLELLPPEDMADVPARLKPPVRALEAEIDLPANSGTQSIR